MAFDNTNVVPAATVYSSTKLFELVAGKSLKIETGPQGDDLLDETVPDGKKWLVTIRVSAREVAA